MSAQSIPKRLITSRLQFSERSQQLNNNKKRCKFFTELNTTNIEPILEKKLAKSIRNSKLIKTLFTNFPTKTLTHAISPCLKGLKRLIFRSSEELSPKTKHIARIHRKISVLQSYHCSLPGRSLHLLRLFTRIDFLNLRITDKTFKQVPLKILAQKIRNIIGLEKVSISMLRISLSSILEFIRLLPNVQRFAWNLTELSLKGDEGSDLCLLEKVGALDVTSVQKQFIQFFMKNIEYFKSLKLLTLSGNNPTIMKLGEFEDLNIFSQLQHLDNLRVLKLYFRSFYPMTKRITEFYENLTFPENLEKLHLDLDNLVSWGKEGSWGDIAHGLKQLENLQRLKSFHLRLSFIETEENSEKNLFSMADNNFFSLLPQNIPNLKVCYLDIFSVEKMHIKIRDVFGWLATHKNLEYVHLSLPRIDFQGLKDFNTEGSFLKLRQLQALSLDKNTFAQEDFLDYLNVLAGMKELKTLSFNAWGEGKQTEIDVENIVKRIVTMTNLRDLTISINAQDIPVEEFLCMREIPGELGSLKSFLLFARKRGYDISGEVLQKFVQQFEKEKIRMGKSLGIFINDRTLL